MPTNAALYREAQAGATARLMNAAPRRPFNRAAFLASYRARCVETGLDPVTGNPQGRADPHWWADPALWAECGRNHSSVEADALRSIAAQARAAHGLAEPRTLADVVREAWHEDGAARSRQMALPLRELHRRRGVTIETIEGMRLEVAIKLPAYEGKMEPIVRDDMPKQGAPYFIQKLNGVETYWHGWLNKPDTWRQITREEFYRRVSEWADVMIAIDRMD